MDLETQIKQLKLRYFSLGKLNGDLQNELRLISSKVLEQNDKSLATKLYSLMNHKMNTQERFEWMTSKWNGQIFYPVDDDFESCGGETKDVDLPVQIVQSKKVDDCSLVSSMICLRGYLEPLVKIQDDKAIIGLHFNGCQRLVQTSLELPEHTVDGKFYHRMIEKLYMQVRAPQGYATPGSNTAIDVFLLTGWIPEYTRELPSCSAYNDGLFTMAMGTSSTTTNLVRNHDYPVVKFEDGVVTLQNTLDGQLLSVVDLKDFDICYINWNWKKLFTHHETVYVLPNQQLTFKSNGEQQVWVLLEKMLNDTEDVNLSVYTGSERVLGGRQPFYKAIASNSFQLSKLKLNEESYVLAPQCKKMVALHVYSLGKLNLEKVSFKHTHVKKVDATALCNWFSTEYFKNPTYLLSIRSETQSSVTVDALLTADSMVNFQLFLADDPELTKPVNKEAYASTNYQQLTLYTNVEYLVVLSTFGSPTECHFLINSPLPVDMVQELPLFQKDIHLTQESKHVQYKFATTHDGTRLDIRVRANVALSASLMTSSGEILVPPSGLGAKPYGHRVACVVPKARDVILSVETLHATDVILSVGSNYKVI